MINLLRRKHEKNGSEKTAFLGILLLKEDPLGAALAAGSTVYCACV